MSRALSSALEEKGERERKENQDRGRKGNQDDGR